MLRPRTALVCVVLAFGTAVAVGAPGALAQTRRAPPPAGFQELSLQSEGIQRWLVYHVPTRNKSTSSIPLVVALHGGGGGMYNMAKARGDLVALADSRGFVVAFPNGQDGNDNKGASGWKAAHCCGLVFTAGRSDVTFLRAAIAALQKIVSVDSRRIHVIGFSNGAMLAHRFAAEASDVVASFAAMAGTVGGTFDRASPKSVIAPLAPVPALLFHGTSDVRVNYRGGYSIDNRERYDVSFDESTTLWVQRNGCRSTPMSETKTGGKGRITIQSFRGCTAGADVTTVSLEGVGHTWIDLKDAGFDGTTLAVDFFGLHSKSP